MPKTIEAVYEDGVIKPLTPLRLKERRIRILILSKEKKELTNFFGILKGEKIDLEKERDEKIEDISQLLGKYKPKSKISISKIIKESLDEFYDRYSFHR